MTDADKIRALNDTFRTTFISGRVFLTDGVQALADTSCEAVMTKVREFDSFSADNDPHGDYDFGAFDHADVKFFWKFDYHAPNVMHGSEDPADPAVTRRVLTIMRADEY